MSIQTTRTRHRARGARRLTRYLSALRRPITLVVHTAHPDDAPPFALPAEGHMAQRPIYPAPAVAAFHIGNQVRIARYDAFPAHLGREGLIVAIAGTFRPLVVDLVGGGTVYLETDEVELVAISPADTLVMDALDDVELMGGAR